MSTQPEQELDPWAANWLAENSAIVRPFEEIPPPEILELARGDSAGSPRIDLAEVRDDRVGDVPIRIYRPGPDARAVIVYFHGGGWMLCSIGIMDDVARQLALRSNAVVISVGYRLTPEHPFPAGLDDCEAVTRWALRAAPDLGASPDAVFVAGESSGGNLSAAVALRLRNAGVRSLAGQVLIYPTVDNGAAHYPSRAAFDGIVISRGQIRMYWDAYAGDNDIDSDPYAAPIHATSLAGLPPALVLVGGCDPLRDEGLAYAARLDHEGVEMQSVCYDGQPHNFFNFDFPAAAQLQERIAEWVRSHTPSRS